MAEVRTEIDLFDAWYRIADVDRDGKVGGGEAVPFLQRSGLGKDALFKIWGVVAGESAFLSKQQFYSTMRLISVAQRNGGKLEEAEARSVLIGIGPPVPPPRMAGLEQLKTPVTQLAPQAPPATMAPPKAAGGAVGSFPAMSPDSVQRYQAMFAQLDGDHDGWVQGMECFTFMMQWGLGREVLREIWGLVAGDSGQLSTHQFISAIYLMDNAKQGLAPPKRLPAGSFPPMVAAELQASQATVAGLQGFQDVFSRQIQVPPLPAKAAYAPQAQNAAHSRLPRSDSALESSLGYSERQRVTREREESMELESKALEAQAQLEATKAAQAYYQKALQELTLFKSKTSAALLQAEEWAGREEREAAEVQARYESTYSQAEAQYKGSRAVLADIQTARAKKLEAQTKLEGLQHDIEQLGKLSGEQARTEEAQVEGLQQQIAVAEAERARLDVRGEALRRAAARLEELAGGASLALTAADAQLMQIDRDYTKLHVEYVAEDSAHVGEVQRLLAVTADTYKGLLDLAQQGGTPIPQDAVIPPLPAAACEPTWDDAQVVAAVDWHDFEGDAFKVVIAMPEYNKRAAAARASAAVEIEAALKVAAETEVAENKALAEKLEAGATGGDAADAADGEDVVDGSAADTEAPELKSAPIQASSMPAGVASADAPAAEARQSPRKGQAAGALAAGGTHLGKRQLPDPLAAATPAQRHQMSSSIITPAGSELIIAQDAAPAVSKAAAASKWEDDMINWSI